MHVIMLTVASTLKIQLPYIDYSSIAPELILSGAALVSLVGSSLTHKRELTWPYTAVGVVASAVAGFWSYHLFDEVRSHGATAQVAGAIAQDGFSTFLMVLISVSLLLSLLVAQGVFYRAGTRGPEFSSLLLLSSTGAMFMASANDLIVVFLGLEILSIALYVLVGFERSKAPSQEGAMKYFILGSFSSAIFLYGIALVYGATGSTNLAEISSFLARNTLTSNGVLLAGMTLILVGLGFKVAAVPFHFWTPDVYQGAATSVTGFMAGVAKAAGFAALLRIFYVPFSTLSLDWRPEVMALAVASMVIGAVLAVTQRDVKRMLAYSSINHAGFILIGLSAVSAQGISDSLYYLFAYSVMIIGTFGVVSLVSASQGNFEGTLPVSGLRGLSRRSPVLALTLAVFLVAQAGAPFTTGFLAKFSVISAAVQNRDYWLAVVAMMTAVVAVFFYLRMAFAIYADRGELATASSGSAMDVSASEGTTSDGDEQGQLGDLMVAEESVVDTYRPPVATLVGIGIAMAFTIFFGVFSSPLVSFAHQATLLH